MPYDVEWKQGAIEDVTTLFDYIAENSSLWDAQNVTDRVLAAADKLADFPRLYEVDSRYGEDVRRISLMGQHVSVKTGNNARNGGKNSLNRLIRCVCGKKIGPDPRNFNQRVSLGRNDLLIRTFLRVIIFTRLYSGKTSASFLRVGNRMVG
ncbi:COG3668: Plasmid stabilization system protein [Klebsiella pneumoniae subsp. pneumoniae ST512-K30BO]|nr:COG3668: Plasmid stabilization system protein [Klebsiella pneumoniae subsp. pneumoniae ST512-K30BO]